MAAEAKTRRCWASVAAVWLAVLAAGCSGEPQTPAIEPVLSPPPPSAAVETTDSGADEALQTGSADTRHSDPDAAERSQQAEPSRTADAAGPFGERDVWQGAQADPSGLQRPLEPSDRPGPLFALSSPGYATRPVGNSYQVKDQCERLDLLAAVKSAEGWGALVRLFGYSAWTRKSVEEALADCTSRRYYAEAEGTDYHGTQGRYFQDRDNAQGWLSELERETARSRTLPSDASGMGSNNSDGARPDRLGGIWFAPWDDPLDDVRVLAGTVEVRDGVLRGLVRNWSRHLWAYGLTVSAGGREFVWPLSVQPGEKAPFEIAGWDGPEDSERINVDVDADMSWHADPSRAFSRSHTRLHYWVGEYAQRTLPDSVRDRYPQVTEDVAPDAVSAGVLEWTNTTLDVPDSHPSLADDIESLTVADLRGYGALFDRDGRIVDVAAAPVGRVWYADDESETDIWQRRRWEDVPSLPHGEFGLIGVGLRLDVHAPWPELEALNWRLPVSDYVVQLQFEPEDGDWWREYIEGGYIFWIGAAYPQLDASMK